MHVAGILMLKQLYSMDTTLHFHTHELHLHHVYGINLLWLIFLNFGDLYNKMKKQLLNITDLKWRESLCCRVEYNIATTSLHPKHLVHSRPAP